MIGSTLSHYHIESEIGRGGMGIVYRATDTKLNRTVAIKVLPSAALATADDRARFYREAQAAAQLHHSSIATIFQIDEAVPSDAPHGTQPSPFIVMEFIEGETLEVRIKKGPLKLKEVSQIAKEVASALELAHTKKIVHRDIKSANVMLTTKGSAKVLDFGLAKTAQSTQLTRMGSTMGTVAFMSPEQARGEEVDGRTDLWALGVVLYEMISGRNPFGGDYEQAVVYSILNEDPEPLTAVRTGVPMELESIVSKCLRKEAKHRYQSATDLIADLENAENKGLFAGSGVNVSRMSMKPSTSVKPAKTLWPFALAFAAFVVGGALVWAAGNQGPSTEGPVSTDVIRSTIVLPAEYPFLPAQGNGLGLEISNLDITKDGKLLVYVTEFEGTSALAIRNLEARTTRVLPETKDAVIPRFSPDGKWIAYISGSELYQVAVEAGRPRFISAVANPTGHFWNADNHIYVGDIQGATFDKLTLEGDRTHLVPDSRCNCGMPTAGPGGQGMVVSGRDEERVLWFQEGKEVRNLDINGSHLTFLSDSYVLYARTGTLYASRFDAAAGTTVGNEHVVLNDLRTGSIVRSGHYATSDAGTLVYVAGQPSGLTTVVVRSPNGDEEDIGLPQGVYGPVDISPDERFVIILSRDRGGQYIQFDRRTKTSRTLPTSGRRANAIWSADGSRIAFSHVENGRSKVYSSTADGSNQKLLFETEGEVALEGWSSDTNFIAFNATLSGLSRLFIQDLTQQTRREIRPDSVSSFWASDWSRKGDFLTYTRVGEGGSAVMIEAFPFDGQRKVISISGGEEAEWLPDQDAFVYRNGSEWFIVRQEGSTLDSFSDPKLLFDGPYANIAGMEYRMMKDGKAILQRSLNTSEKESRIEVVSGLDKLVEELVSQNE